MIIWHAELSNIDFIVIDQSYILYFKSLLFSLECASISHLIFSKLNVLIIKSKQGGIPKISFLGPPQVGEKQWTEREKVALLFTHFRWFQEAWICKTKSVATSCFYYICFESLKFCIYNHKYSTSYYCTADDNHLSITVPGVCSLYIMRGLVWAGTIYMQERYFTEALKKATVLTLSLLLWVLQAWKINLYDT